MSGKTKTAVYLRLSIEDSDIDGSESNSIFNQRRMLMEYIREDRELSQVETLEFCDDGFSGTSMDRPGMQALLECVKRREIGCILVKDMSRFSRDYIETGTYLNQIFPFMGVRFISVNDHYDSREHEGSTIGIDTAFQTLLYDLYSKDVSVKVKSSLQSKYADGEYAAGQVAFGYEKSKEKRNEVVVNEAEAAIVRRIFSLADGGMGCAEIAAVLAGEGIPTPMQIRCQERKTGKKDFTWYPAAIRNILHNRFYLGEMAYGKTVRKYVGSKRGYAVPREEWKVVPNHHEALVTPEVFERASRSQPGYITKRKREKHPLTGVIYCGGCGYSLNYKPHSNYTKVRYFWCKKHSILKIPECCTYFNAAVLEEIVLKELYQELMRRGSLIKQKGDLETYQQVLLEQFRREGNECRRQRREGQKEKDALYERYTDGQIGAEEYRQQADELAEQLVELDRKIVEIKGRQEALERDWESDKENMKQIIRFSGMTELTQEMVDAFVKRVTVYKDKRVEIEWKFTE